MKAETHPKFAQPYCVMTGSLPCRKRSKRFGLVGVTSSQHSTSFCATLPSSARVSLLSSPNPFDVDAQPISFQSSVRRPRGSLVAERSKVYEQSPSEPVAEYALSDSEDELENMDSRVIKITSEDPMAAARAAAILRLVRNFLPPSKPF